MTDLLQFKFKNHTIAYAIVDGNPWFKAKEVAAVLGYTNTMKAIIDHVDAEDKQRMDALMGVRETPLSTTTERRYLSTSQVCTV